MSSGFGWRNLAIAVLSLLLLGATAAAADGDAAKLRSGRPAVLVPLYFGFAALQALDAHSTLTALDAGARESNPLMRPAVDSPATMLLIKGASAAGVVALSERLWRRNRTAAVLTMISLNSAYAIIAAHNYNASARSMRGAP